MTDICPDAATAPRGCGLVRVQIIRDARGQPIAKWVCTFCAEQRSISAGGFASIVALGQPAADVIAFERRDG
jgi:hypothetical protein